MAQVDRLGDGRVTEHSFTGGRSVVTVVISDSDEYLTSAGRRPVSVFGRLGAGKRSTRRGAWTVGRLITAAYLLLLAVIVAFPAALAPHSPYTQDLSATLRPPVWAKGGSAA